MKKKYNHYMAVLSYTGAVMCLIVFFWTRYTMVAVAMFFLILNAIVFRNEYQFKTIVEEIRER